MQKVSHQGHLLLFVFDYASYEVGSYRIWHAHDVGLYFALPVLGEYQLTGQQPPPPLLCGDNYCVFITQ